MKKIDIPLFTEGKNNTKKPSHRGKMFGYQVLGFGSGGSSSPFLEATGGTVTESGDYKVHKFLSSSTFVVTNSPKDPAGGDGLRYLVVAAGGAFGGDTSRGGDSAVVLSPSTTITSTGGGYGGNYGSSGAPGGSGGGSGEASNSAGSGNTPPVSPSQGNPGGVGS